MRQTDITTHISSLSLNGPTVTSYVCGPPDMIDSVTEWLGDSGVPEEHILTERWW